MKSKEISTLTDEELLKKAADLKQDYANMKVNASLGNLENPIRLRTIRKDIARILTEVSKRKNS